MFSDKNNQSSENNPSPFKGGDQGSLFSDTELQQRFDLLKHLAQYGQQPILIKGESGIGKSVLVAQLLEQANSNWRTTLIEGNPLLTEDQVFVELARTLDLQLANKRPEEMVAQVRRRLEALCASGLNPILIIDDAHVIPQQTLAAVMHLGKHRDEDSNSGCKVILAADTSIEFMLAALPGQETLGEPTRIELQALNRKQTDAYISQRLDASGWRHEPPFSKAELETIYNNSLGVPEKINLFSEELFQKLITRSAPVGQAPKRSPGRAITIVKLTGILLLTLITITALLLQDRINQFFEEPQTTPSSTKRLFKSAQPVALPIPSKSINTRSNATKSTTEKPKVPGASSPVAPKVNPATENKSTDGSKTSASVPIALKVETKKPIEKPAVSIAKATPKNPKYNRRETWLLQQKPEFYTLQLLGAGSEKAVLEFIRHQNISTEAMYFKINREGKDWFTLVFRIYPSRKSARQAIRFLPKQLQKARPWARDIAGIQKAIRNRNPK